MPFKSIWGGANRDTYDNPNECPSCKSTNTEITDRSGGFDTYKCNACGNEWLVPQ